MKTRVLYISYDGTRSIVRAIPLSCERNVQSYCCGGIAQQRAHYF